MDMNYNSTPQDTGESLHVNEDVQQNTPITIPVVEEQLKIGTKVIETGKVRITKKVNEYDEFVNIPLVHEKINIERTEINRFVDTAPEARYEGETMIIPVVKEVSVVRIMLVEEVRITKHKELSHNAQYVKLRKEEVLVERNLPGLQTNITD